MKYIADNMTQEIIAVLMINIENLHARSCHPAATLLCIYRKY